jgi:hypothetical protein
MRANRSASDDKQLFSEDVGNWAELELRQKFSQPSFCMPQVDIMSESRKQRSRFDTGLLGIEFPWMKVNDRGMSFAIDFPNRPRCDRQWKEPEISAAGYLPVAANCANRT